MLNPDTIRFVADVFLWSEIDCKDKSMVSFKKDGVRINIYFRTQTVATALKHPAKGKTQLYRRNVPMNQLVALFKNPRKHTGKGYYRCPNSIKFTVI